MNEFRLGVSMFCVNCVFDTTAPNEAWVGDVTYIATADGWLYLAVLLDLFSRRVVGWATSDTNDRALAIAAFQQERQAICH